MAYSQNTRLQTKEPFWEIIFGKIRKLFAFGGNIGKTFLSLKNILGRFLKLLSPLQSFIEIFWGGLAKLSEPLERAVAWRSWKGELLQCIAWKPKLKIWENIWNLYSLIRECNLIYCLTRKNSENHYTVGTVLIWDHHYI